MELFFVVVILVVIFSLVALCKICIDNNDDNTGTYRARNGASRKRFFSSTNGDVDAGPLLFSHHSPSHHTTDHVGDNHHHGGDSYIHHTTHDARDHGHHGGDSGGSDSGGGDCGGGDD